MSDAQISEALHSILAEPEFQPDWGDSFSHWLGVIKDWLFDWLGDLPDGARWLLLAFLTATLLWIVYDLARGLSEASGSRTREGASDAPEALATQTSASALALTARALADAGRWREAARALQQAVYQTLAAQRALAWSASTADWEWVSRLGSDPALRDFTDRAQAVAYGVAQAQDFETCWSGAKVWLAGP